MRGSDGLERKIFTGEVVDVEGLGKKTSRTVSCFARFLA
jgi:hypothetical protein